MYIRLCGFHFNNKQHVLCHKLVIADDPDLDVGSKKAIKCATFG